MARARVRLTKVHNLFNHFRQTFHAIHISSLTRISIFEKRFLPSSLILIDGRLSVPRWFSREDFSRVCRAAATSGG